MSARRISGFILLLVGAVLQPLGWMYVTELAVVSFLGIVAGVLLLYAGQGNEAVGSEGDSFRPTGRESPGDIYGHSGQLAGGRATAWESNHLSDEGSAND